MFPQFKNKMKNSTCLSSIFIDEKKKLRKMILLYQQQLWPEALCFWVVSTYMYCTVCLSHPFLLALYIRNTLTELLKIWYECPLGLNNELILVVKGQGHCDFLLFSYNLACLHLMQMFISMHCPSKNKSNHLHYCKMKLRNYFKVNHYTLLLANCRLVFTQSKYLVCVTANSINGYIFRSNCNVYFE